MCSRRVKDRETGLAIGVWGTPEGKAVRALQPLAARDSGVALLAYAEEPWTGRKAR